MSIKQYDGYRGKWENDWKDYSGSFEYTPRVHDTRRAFYGDTPRAADNIPFIGADLQTARTNGWLLLKMRLVTLDNVKRAVDDLHEYLKQKAASKFLYARDDGDERNAVRIRNAARALPVSWNEITELYHSGNIVKMASNVAALKFDGSNLFNGLYLY